MAKSAGQAPLGEAVWQGDVNFDRREDHWCRQPAALEALLNADLAVRVLSGPVAVVQEDVRCLRRAKDYIQMHVSRALTVGEIARHAHVAPRTLELVFKRYVKEAPIAYSRRLRLEAVHREFSQSVHHHRPLTVMAVALDHGFTHMGRFAAQYRRQFGCSPSETLKRLAVCVGVDSGGPWGAGARRPGLGGGVTRRPGMDQGTGGVTDRMISASTSPRLI